tara:strand:- start:145 stop:432 length:288 start_codon:yes stop_codon:yes gene_type:complete
MKKESQYVYENPRYVAQQIKDIVDIMLYKMSLEARNNAYPNILSKLNELNVAELASKKNPGGAAIGVSLSLIKNMMNGKNPAFITQTLDELAKML